MSPAAIGGIVGIVVGGVGGFFLTKAFLKRGDIGVAVAAGAAGGLIGAAVSAKPAEAATTTH